MPETGRYSLVCISRQMARSLPLAYSQPGSISHAFVTSFLFALSVVVASTENLFASRPEHEAMLQLSRIAAFDID